jgi:hypothetical protein
MNPKRALVSPSSQVFVVHSAVNGMPVVEDRLFLISSNESLLLLAFLYVLNYVCIFQLSLMSEILWWSGLVKLNRVSKHICAAANI